MNETETKWEATRFGGVRRTRVVQTPSGGGTAKVASAGAEAIARAGADKGVDTRSTQAERSPHTGEVGGSSPSPRTQFIVKWRETLGVDTCPYLIRWRFETPWFSVRLHHWLGPDDDRAPHDHPWSFVTFVLRGGYTDVSPAGDEHLKAPAIRYRDATHQHTVVPDDNDCWTIIFTGPKVRAWGFWIGSKFVKANKWFLSRGHHPCS